MEAKNAKATTSLIRGNTRSISDMRLMTEPHLVSTPPSRPGETSRLTVSTQERISDYLLGYTSAGGRNFPLQTFGMKHSPYSAIYIQDAWKPTSNLTINLGLRYDRWHAKRAVRGNVTSFDPGTGPGYRG